MNIEIINFIKIDCLNKFNQEKIIARGDVIISFPKQDSKDILFQFKALKIRKEINESFTLILPTIKDKETSKKLLYYSFSHFINDLILEKFKKLIKNAL